MKTSAPNFTERVDVEPIDSDPGNKRASSNIVLLHRSGTPQGKLRPGSSGQRGRYPKDEREAERKRIARELHDTLLQGVQGVLLEIEQFSQASSLTDEQRERAIKIERQLRNIVVDGRDAISALRSPIGERDWMAFILQMGDRLAMKSPIGFSLHIRGDPWKPQPNVRSEVLAIVREGLRNAFEHSHARTIQVTLGYTTHRLRIAIEDDGIGISKQQVRRRQKEGHWGIVGMRERAEKLGARLTITGLLEGGTRIQFAVPRRFPLVVPRLLFAP